MGANRDTAPPSHREDRGLQIDDRPEFHRRVWLAQRVSWVVLLAIVLCGMAGLLGSGPMSRTVAGEGPNQLRVEYDRFARAESSQMMRIEMPGPAHAEGRYRLSISRPFIERTRIDEVVPPPAVAEAAGNEFVYVFVGQPGGAVATVHFTPRAMGVLSAHLAAAGVSPTPIRIVVYP